MRVLCVLIAGLMAIMSAGSGSVQAASPQDRPLVSVPSSPQRALLDRYCVTCHNEKLRTAELTLDTMDLANVSARADVWEKVIRKLRAGTMPPAGRPRPDKPTYAGFASWLETEIDGAAAARPNPGRTETFHRLNRTEYQNAIRDLFGLEIDAASLLPSDGRSYGFDNIAGVLQVSPPLLERYMVVARQISRLAIGNPALPPTAETFRLRSDLSQADGAEALPMGTRGGTAIRHTFPLDAEYTIKVELTPDGRRAEPHQLEISVDGERVELFTVEPRKPAADGYQVEKDHGFQVRLPVKAGSRVVAVTFVEKTSALVETVRQPFFRPLASSEVNNSYQPDIASVTISGPFEVAGPGDTPSRRRIFVCRPTSLSDEVPCVNDILSTLARRVYRRPVTDADLQGLLTFYNDGRIEGGFEAGIEMALRALLVSPQFLFRIERAPENLAPNTAYHISDLELASRLSFFLWSSIPDDELLDVASRGELKDPVVLEQQVRRMLADPRSEALAMNFAGQWLLLRNLPALTPNEFSFPNFNENMRQDFRRETELFFESILREDRSVLGLLMADYTFVNERLARHYGIPNVYGSHFRRVTLTDENRRGLLGQGSFLTATSYSDRTSVVLRGKWILQNLLGTPPPPPPPNVPPLEETKGTGKVLSLRERMEQHRKNPVCASCHSMIDPLGFALENFDATGRWRSSEAFTPWSNGVTAIDASGVLTDGTKFDGPAGLRAVLLSRPEQVVTTLTEALLTYALGRGVEYYDAPAVRKIVRDAARSDYSFSSLILSLVKSTPFQMRTAAPAPGTVGGQ